MVVGYHVGDTVRRKEKEDPTGEYWGTWVLTAVIKNDDGELFYEYTKVSDEVRKLPELTCCACRHSVSPDISSGTCDLDGVSYFGYKEACDLFTYRVVYESVKR